MRIQTPRENLLFIIDVKAMLVPTENVNCIFGATFFDFKGLLVFFASVEHSANFARFSISPSVDVTFVVQSQGVLLATCDFDDFLL